MTIAVIGAGASGMMAALTAAEQPENKILLFERQARVGRKLAVTGNGRCNLTNTGAAPENYHGAQPDFAAPALAAFPPEAALRWFAAHGLMTVTEPGGRVYPLSNAANSVVDVLRFALARPNIALRAGEAVTAVRRQGRGFVIETESETTPADRVIIACGGAPLAWVEEQVRIARSMTDKPIGANVMLMDPNAGETAELLAKLRVDVITTGAGSPANYLQMWKDAGIKVVPVVASSALAARMERLGADAVVAEGTEAGGHIGELTTMALIPAVCDAVSIPVIAAGGIADGRGMAAAFALGAEGVQVGTRFLTVEECTIADAYKERVIAAKDADTIVTGRGSGHPVRCLKNKFARTVRKLEGDVAANGDELEAMYVGSLKRAVEGDVDNGTMMAGQSAALVRERATAAEAIASLVAEAEELGGLGLEALAARNATRGEAR